METPLIETEAFLHRVRAARQVMSLIQQPGDGPVGVMLLEVQPGGEEAITSFILDELATSKTGNVVPITREQLRALAAVQRAAP